MSSPRSADVPAKLSFVPPQLASPAEKPPSGQGWIHEIKQDGWRVQLLVEGGKARAMTRRGLDWTSRFKDIAKAAGGLSCRSAIIDGEAVVQDIAGAKPPVFIGFDLLHLDGEDFRRRPLSERRDRLADLLFGVDAPLGFSEVFTGSGDEIFDAAAKMGLEGIVSKKADSRYQSGPSKTWLKAKIWDEDVFTLIGFEIDGRGYPIPLLAREHAGLFTFAGAALVGLPDEVGDRVAELQPVARAPVSGHDRAGVTTWLEPILRVKVRHRRAEAGSDLRHASVIGFAAEST
jgi:bifunctional non-homologous end joining protein LigD